MKPIKNQASCIAGLSSLSTESKLCFGAAGGCAIIGVTGYAFNVLTSSETTLSAFLVISAFYLIPGVIGVFKASQEYSLNRPAPQPQYVTDDDNEPIESAA